jgi:putative intracellular protease/amidase
VAYLIDPRPLAATRLVFALLREGFKVAVSRRPFGNAGRDWPVGTFVLRTERNEARLHDRVGELAREAGAEVVGVDRSWTETGIDLGSPQIDSLRLPRIAVAAEEPTDETAFGEVWFLLEQRLAHPFTALRTAQLASAELARYDVIVLPDGDDEEYLRILGERGVERLLAWVREGGVLVCSGGAARFAANRKVRFTQAELLGAPRDDEEEDEEHGEGDAEAAPTSRVRTHDDATRTRVTNAGEPAPPAEEDEVALDDAEVLETDRLLDREQARREDETEATPGAIFSADVASGHFLTYGLPSELPVLVTSSDVFTASPTGATVVRLRRQSPLLSGFAWPEAEERLRGAAYAIDEPHRRGHVVVFAENPNFRHFWRGLEKLFTNALLLAPSLD